MLTTSSITPVPLDVDLLSANEVELLIRCCSNRAPTGVRNRALIVLAWRCGLRVSEVLSLAIKDVDPQRGVIVVQHGKGGKRRAVGIDAGALAVVEYWISVRAGLAVSRAAPLVCTLKGGHVDPSYVRHLLPRLAARAGIEKRVHAHGLRHAYAVELEAEGAPLSTIRDALGHSSVGVTDRYLRRVGAGAAIDFGRQRVWGTEPSRTGAGTEEPMRARR